MSKIVRMTGAQQRKWTANAQIVLDEKGSPLREVTPNEARVLVELTRWLHVKKTGARAGTPGEKSVVELHVDRDARTNRMVARFTIDGMDLTDTRSVLRAEFLAEHGECQLRFTNGKFLTAIRDPALVRGTAKDGNRNSTKPEHCPCKAWGDPHPGRHHRVCQENAKAPPEERGDVDMNDPRVSEAEVQIIETNSRAVANRSLPARGVTIPQPVVEAHAVEIYSPEDCPLCQAWVGTVKGEHHPICQHRDAWLAKSSPRMVLVDFESGETLRPAEPIEIAESQVSEKKTGAATVKIGERMYLVVPEGAMSSESVSGEEEPGSGPHPSPLTTPNDAPVQIVETTR